MLPEEKFTISMIEEGLVLVAVAPDVEVNESDIKFVKKKTIELTGGNRYVSLVESGVNSTITREAMSLTASREFSKGRIAMAFVVKTLPHRIITNFYIKFKKPITPTRAFQNGEDARAWLREQLVKEGVSQ